MQTPEEILERGRKAKAKAVDAKGRAVDANAEAKQAKKDKKEAEKNKKKKEAARERARVALEKSEEARREVCEAKEETEHVLGDLFGNDVGSRFTDAVDIAKEVRRVEVEIKALAEETETIAKKTMESGKAKPKATPEAAEASAQASGEQPQQSGAEVELARVEAVCTHLPLHMHDVPPPPSLLSWRGKENHFPPTHVPCTVPFDYYDTAALSFTRKVSAEARPEEAPEATVAEAGVSASGTSTSQSETGMGTSVCVH